MSLDNWQFQQDLDVVMQSITRMLVAKNQAYGDSALDPVRIFSKADPMEQLKVRLDDKLSRIARGSEMGEDVINDLIGYLVIYKIHLGRQKAVCKSVKLPSDMTDAAAKNVTVKEYCA